MAHDLLGGEDAAWLHMEDATNPMVVLAPECRRLSGVDPQAPDVVEAHADAVLSLLFGADRKDH